MTALVERPGMAVPSRLGRFAALVAVADPAVRESVTRTLRMLGAVNVEHAGSVAQARAMARTGPRALFIADAGLPDGSGAQLVSELRAAGWNRCVVLSSSADPFAVRGAVAAGVRCYLVTTRPEGTGFEGRAGDSGVDSLSEREVEVLQHVADGRSNKDTGALLGLSALTVKSHLARIARKLGTGDRAEMVAITLRAGVIQ
ncbi:response regulator transcription factor [Kineococcus sp. SYSU DK005]|uniref:response regulator transcription factor n=1 Tax=Kineococcus sp. SYSU DK005 TaxID=3383126 RepID=UPI003D7D4B60